MISCDTRLIEGCNLLQDEDDECRHVQSKAKMCNPHRLGLVKDLEKDQMCATKLVITIKNLTYKDRLKRLKLPTLKYRHIRGDMIEV